MYGTVVQLCACSGSVGVFRLSLDSLFVAELRGVQSVFLW